MSFYGESSIMSFFEQVSINTLLDKPIAITILVAMALVIFLLLSVMPTLREYLNERRINRAIQQLGSQYLKQVILPDSLGGSIFLDYIVLAQDSIILVILKNFRGTIFCADNIDQWTQLIGNRSYKFPNTLQQLDSDILSVNTLVEDVNVTGLVVFSSDCNFPKGKPEQVKSIGELTCSGINTQLHSEKLLNAWYKLKELSKNHSSTQSFADDYFKVQNIKKDYSISIILVILLGAWLIWRINFAS